MRNRTLLAKEWPHLALILLMLGASLWMAGLLPDRVPTHYNIHGEVDGYGSKWLLLILLPGLSIPIYLMMRFLPLVDDSIRAQGDLGKGYHLVRFIVVLLFAMLHGALLVKTGIVDFPMRFVLTPLFFLLFFALGWQMPSLPRNGVIGIRTTWTLENEEIWRRVHKAARPLMMVGALLYLPIGLISEVYCFAGIMALAVGLLIWSLTYSRRLHNSLKS